LALEKIIFVPAAIRRAKILRSPSAEIAIVDAAGGDRKRKRFLVDECEL